MATWRLPGGDRVTVPAWLTSWISWRTASVRPKNLVGYQLVQKHIDRSIGRVQLGTLTPEHVEKLYAEMAEIGRSAGTILPARRTLSAALATAVSRGRVSRNVVRLAVVPRDEAPEIERLTLVEAQAIARVAADRRNGARWLVALALGLRQSEVLGLLWADVDWGSRNLVGSARAAAPTLAPRLPGYRTVSAASAGLPARSRRRTDHRSDEDSHLAREPRVARDASQGTG